MSLDKTDIELITEQDLIDLVDTKIPEGLTLDFKQTLYGNSDKDKRELLKDVSALSNSYGGHLILGATEKKGIAHKINGIDPSIDIDKEKLRIEQILHDGLEPPLIGIRLKSVTLINNNNVLIVRVPRSWNPPHRVKANKSNKFYMRNSAGVYQPGIEELRNLFSNSTTSLEKADQFRDNRISEVINIQGVRPLVSGGRLFIHIIPIASLQNVINIDLVQALEDHKYFFPIGASGASPRFNFQGFINERGGNENHGYTQIFRNGILEATKSKIITNEFISGNEFERNIFMRLGNYIDGLKILDVPPPLIIMFTLEGVLNAKYAAGDGGDCSFSLPIIKLPECIINEYGDKVDYHKAVRPAFDALWNAAGYSKSENFDDSGLWRELY